MSDRLLFSRRFKYCFGKFFLDKGQSLEPDPPERITGISSSSEGGFL